jgi:hypothetical protein
MLALRNCARARMRQERKALKATQQQAMLHAQAGAAPMHLRPAKTKMERSEEEEAAAAAMLSSPGRSSNPGSAIKKRRTDGSPVDYGMSCFTGALFAYVCRCACAPSLQRGRVDACYTVWPRSAASLYHAAARGETAYDQSSAALVGSSLRWHVVLSRASYLVWVSCSLHFIYYFA